MNKTKLIGVIVSVGVAVVVAANQLGVIDVARDVCTQVLAELPVSSAPASTSAGDAGVAE